MPISIKHLSSLQDLYLDGCRRLRSLPELPPSVLALSTIDCLSLTTLPVPLTIEDEEGKEVDCDDEDEEEPFPYFCFTNCMKLDRQSIKAVEAKAVLEMNKGIYSTAKIEYPGNRVPEWFMYRTTQTFVTMDLCSIPQPSWDGSFIFCAVISQSPPSTFIDATWFIDDQQACMAATSFGTTEFTLSDHVFVWYDSYSFEGLRRKIEEKKKDAQNNTYHPLVEIEFTVTCWKSLDYGRIGKIKGCGVCPTSAIEYQQYIKQIKSALQQHLNSTAMGSLAPFTKTLSLESADTTALMNTKK